ncbi:MAG: thymidine kinase [Nitrososphaerota archaeon]|jgi:thymidine kinase|nr:thymidine kinase [Nitrososphaerota archaeon]MDG6932901.1 thymidine kinase [Nitrososphaerota archaeon]MDG6936368.1 thymidine kinase [Nitrososphaerota archaeon]MDG6944367.1 thymidine kinase [Nitrososphaerota archaeon]
MAGWIKVYTGPMFSRKTEELIVELHRYMLAKKRVVLFKHKIDTRYGEGVMSHDGRKMNSTPVDSSEEVFAVGKGYDVIGVDEAQFFDHEIINVCEKLADAGLRVVVAGLDKNYLGEPFGPMPQLLAIADEVVKLTAVCTVCGNPATFTVRKVSDGKEVLIGGMESYEPRCRMHRLNISP